MSPGFFWDFYGILSGFGGLGQVWMTSERFFGRSAQDSFRMRWNPSNFWLIWQVFEYFRVVECWLDLGQVWLSSERFYGRYVLDFQKNDLGFLGILLGFARILPIFVGFLGFLGHCLALRTFADVELNVMKQTRAAKFNFKRMCSCSEWIQMVNTTSTQQHWNSHRDGRPIKRHKSGWKNITRWIERRRRRWGRWRRRGEWKKAKEGGGGGGGEETICCSSSSSSALTSTRRGSFVNWYRVRFTCFILRFPSFNPSWTTRDSFRILWWIILGCLIPFNVAFFRNLALNRLCLDHPSSFEDFFRVFTSFSLSFTIDFNVTVNLTRSELCEGSFWDVWSLSTWHFSRIWL